MDDLQELMTVRACSGLPVAFATAADRRDADALAALFAMDGTLAFGETRLAGRDAIRSGLNERWATPPPAPRRHFVTNITIDVLDDRHATGTAYLLVAGRMPLHAGAELHAIADVRDHYVRTADGWRISERQLDWVVAAP
jgi:uncharacterized protein (TIGR02246 family)